MKTWIFTDTHLGHSRMIEFGRPPDFESKILKSLKDVKEDDLFIHLGDVCIGRDEYNNERLLQRVPCKKWLIKGNHDRKSYSWYLSHGWDFVAEEVLYRLEGQKILLSHIPKEVDQLKIDFNVHGHLHDNGHRTQDYPFMSERNILIALEYTNYQPVLLENIIRDALNKVRSKK